MATTLLVENECLLYGVSLAVETVVALVIARYDPSHSSSPIACPKWPTLKPLTISWQHCGHSEVGDRLAMCSVLADTAVQSYLYVLTSYVFDDPSPALFIGACSVFAMAALVSHFSQRNHRYQNHCLIAGALVALLLSCMQDFITENKSWISTLKMILSMSIVIASVLSALMHHIGSEDNSWRRQKRQEKSSAALSDELGRREKYGSLAVK